MAAADPLAYVSSSRAFAYLTERGEDALHTVKDVLNASSSKYLDADPHSIHRSLESTNDAERLEGLKYVVALVSKGRDASPFLASVFKLASSTSLEVRKLVYIVVLRYAPQHPDLALLSINSFQRDLSEPNPLIRGMALRALSGMRVQDAWSIVVMAVGKAVRDTHPYVRRVAAFALMRCFQMDAENREMLMGHVETLLRDRSPQVLGPAVAAFQELAPTRWDLLHRHVQKLCYALADMDAWSQPLCLDVLVHYARLHFPAPRDDTHTLDAELALLLDHIDLLLTSTQPSTVLAATRALLALGPQHRHAPAVHALLRLVRTTPDVAYIATLRILGLCATHRPYLAPHTTTFYVRVSDPAYLALAKLRVLVQLVQHTDANTMADELVVYTRAQSTAVATESVTALGQIACRYTSSASHCLKLLIGVAQDDGVTEPVASRAVQVAKMLMDIPHVTSEKVVVRLVAQFALRLFVPLALAGRPRDAPKRPILLDPASRSAALWMLGQHCRAPLLPATEEQEGATLCELLVPDVLRCLVAHWMKEHASVQCQALTLSAKAMVSLPETRAPSRVRSALRTLHYALLALGAQCHDADVRDRARFYSGLTRRQDEELPLEPDSALAAFVEQHQCLDRLRLPGVRLRRKQVQHVLFAQDTTHIASMADQLALPTPAYTLEGIPTLHGEATLRGWHAAQLPPWCDPAQRPPAIVRVPETTSVHPDLSHVRSISSASIPRAPEAPMERVVLTPKETPPPARPTAWNARYTNLDAFFDEEESDARPSLDAAAPEEEEYALSASTESSFESD